MLSIEIPKEELNTDRNIIIVTIYRPPDVNVTNFIDKLDGILQCINKENKYIFVMGDFNIDTSKTIINTNISVNNFQNLFFSYSLFPLINIFTRVDKHRGTSTILDNIYTNVGQSANTINSGSFKTQISDHYSIFCITDLVQNTENDKYISKRDFSNKNISKFNKSLKSCDWSTLYTEGLHKEKFTSFLNKFNEIFDENYKNRHIKL